MARQKSAVNKTTRYLTEAILLAAEAASKEIPPGHPDGKLATYLK